MSLIHAHHFVLDLETESTKPNAAITSIGVVYLHIPASPLATPLLYEFYQRTDSQDYGHQDPETLNWWAKQSPEARAEVDGSLPKLPLQKALVQLASFMDSFAPQEHRLIWGNGSSFDNVILASAYRAHNLETPWDYWHDRDLRTLLATLPGAKATVDFIGIKHHALHDARHEACLLLKTLTTLIERREASAEECHA